MTPKLALLTVFGLGRLRPAPGSWGSLVPPAVALGLVSVGTGRPVVNIVLVTLALVFGAVCVMLGDWAEAHFERRDPGEVVADEVCGQSLALLFLPWRSPLQLSSTAEASDAWLWNLALAATAFFAFRFFDIVKPPPADAAQKLPGGWGILVDDIVAGLQALVAVQLLAHLVWPYVLS